MSGLKVKHVHALYWVMTLLFVMPQGWAAVQYLVQAPRMSATFSNLGYPAYFMQILGVAKLLGIAAIVTGISPTLKEWAYAGFTIDVCGAFASHLGAGDALLAALVPAGFFFVQLASYSAWRRLRKLSSGTTRRAFRFRNRVLAEGRA